MKHSVLFGLFVTASLMASASFAAEDLCAVNLKTIENNQAEFQSSEDMMGTIKEGVEKAKADQAKGTEQGTKDCIGETSELIQTMKNAKKGGK
ncbi:tmRNA [Pseudomonas sp. GM21]|jgi:hypothetical protein|uniref:hypothetical protein n=1 Tax=Pseudomonas TaxID=286 RepID=UPI0002723508|nr:MULTISPECIES: hypothetical protein [Pseudomonas]EJM25187.1 tmRNA [Pseudomonas sp. GM21]MDR6927364.1 hypothetical protein [Pseudomonas sp. BE134]MDR7282605.1 hypothetical protein [Pseudomonas corrugata]